MNTVGHLNTVQLFNVYLRTVSTLVRLFYVTHQIETASFMTMCMLFVHEKIPLIFIREAVDSTPPLFVD